MSRRQKRKRPAGPKGPLVELFTLRLDEAAHSYFMDVENIGQIGSDHPLEAAIPSAVNLDGIICTLVKITRAGSRSKVLTGSSARYWSLQAHQKGPLRKEQYGPLNDLRAAPDNWSATDEAVTSPPAKPTQSDRGTSERKHQRKQTPVKNI